jgi:hypothetical protein
MRTYFALRASRVKLDELTKLSLKKNRAAVYAAAGLARAGWGMGLLTTQNRTSESS